MRETQRQSTLRRFLATLAIAVVGTTVVGASIALAAELEITPSEPAPGETELTLAISGFEADTSVFAVPCEVPASGDASEVTTADCDVVAVEATVTDANGEATLVVTWDIPEGGIAVYVGDETRSNQVAQIVTTADINVTADGETTEAVTDENDPTNDVEVLGTSVVQETNDTADDLADTGPREVVLLLMGAALLLALGTATATASRRFDASV